LLSLGLGGLLIWLILVWPVSPSSVAISDRSENSAAGGKYLFFSNFKVVETKYKKTAFYASVSEKLT